MSEIYNWEKYFFKSGLYFQILFLFYYIEIPIISVGVRFIDFDLSFDFTYHGRLYLHCINIYPDEKIEPATLRTTATIPTAKRQTPYEHASDQSKNHNDEILCLKLYATFFRSELFFIPICVSGPSRLVNKIIRQVWEHFTNIYSVLSKLNAYHNNDIFAVQTISICFKRGLKCRWLRTKLRWGKFYFWVVSFYPPALSDSSRFLVSLCFSQ